MAQLRELAIQIKFSGAVEEGPTGATSGKTTQGLRVTVWIRRRIVQMYTAAPALMAACTMSEDAEILIDSTFGLGFV